LFPWSVSHAVLAPVIVLLRWGVALWSDEPRGWDATTVSRAASARRRVRLCCGMPAFLGIHSAPSSTSNRLPLCLRQSVVAAWNTHTQNEW